MPRDVDIIGCLFGTTDFYLVAALLHASYTPKIIQVSYNRNFGTHGELFSREFVITRHTSIVQLKIGPGLWNTGPSSFCLSWSTSARVVVLTFMSSPSDSYAVLPELGHSWSLDCYYSASALALQRLMKKYDYTVVSMFVN